ncbi:GNAT family N-acetyltransferase [Planococcus sp. MB-3u-03]
MGVHSDSRGKGVGKALFSHVIAWAKSVDLHRLELTVIAENVSAVALYQKMGLEIEGVKRDSLFINDGYVDEYYMAKLL